MTFDITTDAVEVNKAFYEFTTKEMRKTLLNALRQCSRELAKETKQQLRKSLHNTNKTNPKYNDTLEQGVRSTKAWENKGGDLVALVRIDSNRKTGSGSFRLHILERGTFKTPNRYAYTKTHNHKRAYRGSLRAYNFFSSASNNYLNTYQNKLNSSINKAVDNINKKKIGK